jgi:KAP family P-loop domain
MASAPVRPEPADPEILQNADAELVGVFQTAARIGEHSHEEHLYSFTTLLAAIYYANGRTCEWWHSYVDRAGIKIGDMLSGLGVKPDDLTSRVPVTFSKQRLTTSASRLLEKAEDMYGTTGARQLGVRHLLGSYIFRMPINHYKQALSWNFDPAKAAPAFLDFLRSNYPTEMEVWEQLAATATGDPSLPAGSQASPRTPPDNVLKQEFPANNAPVQQTAAEPGADKAAPRPTSADFASTEGVSRVLNLARQIVGAEDTGSNVAGRITSRAVFFAIVDFGAVAPGTAAAALYKAIRSSKATLERYSSLRKSYNPAKIDVLKVPQSSSPVPFSQNLGLVFKRALELARATTHAEVIGLRHLTAAFLLEGPNLGGGRLSKALETLALDTGSFLYRMYQDLRKNLPSEDMGAWEKALFASGPRDVPEYSADDDKGPDLLNVKDDVEAFAAVMAAHDLHPPLSVGLFGDWGSGKSFFMRMLRDRIDQIALAAAKEKSRIFCSQIVQIPFNAWFYVDHSLWATLVSEIFDKLFIAISGGPVSPEDAKKEIQAKLEKAEGLFKEARKELDDAKSALVEAQKRLDKLVEDRQAKEQTLSESLNDLGSLLAGKDEIKKQLDDVRRQMGLPEAARSFQALEEQIGQAQTLGRRIATMVLSVFQPPGVFLRIAALACVFVAPVLVWWIVSRLPVTKEFHDLAMLVGSAGTFAMTAATWIARQVKRGSGIISRAESVFAQLQAIREKRIREDTAPQRAELQQVQERESAARKQVADTELQVQTLQRELDEMQPGARMQKFIRERTTSTDYSKHLGLVSLIRKDFQTLSDLVESREDIPVQRIVLYIDDLDRCPPDRVVEVLEAIHLLLAFKLFVVVVGVDARWVIRSLQKEYRGLLTEAAAGTNSTDVATPHDYLEKIFQIPFWIQPMTKDGSKGLITGLLPISAAPTVADGKGSAQVKTDGKVKAEEPAPADEIKQSEQEKNIADNNVEASTGPKSQTNGGPAETAPAPKSSDPGKLILKDFELEYIQELSPYIGRSPRRVKRFVNIYRLLRASVRPGADAVNFIGTRENPGEHRTALVLLTILTGAPTLAPEIMKVLRELPASDSVTKLREQITARLNGHDAGELEAALGALEFFRGKTRERNLRRLQKWEPVMARYSFRPRDTAGLADLAPEKTVQ